MIKTLFVSVICGLFMINMMMHVDASMTEYTLPEEETKVVITETNLSMEEVYNQSLVDTKLEFDKTQKSLKAYKIPGIYEAKMKINYDTEIINSKAEQLLNTNFNN